MLKQLAMTARLNKAAAGSVNRSLQHPEKKPKSAKTPTAEPKSQASVLRTPTTARFFSAFQQFKFLRDDRVLMIGMMRP